MIQGVESFKLVDGGLKGLEANTIELTYRGSFASVDNVKSRRSKLPVPVSLRDKVQALRYYFLSLTFHWHSNWTQRFLTEDHGCLQDIESSDEEYLRVVDLWDRTRINKVKVTENSIRLGGDIEVVDGKKMGLSTVAITEADNYDFYDTLYQKVNDICSDVISYMQSDEYSLEAAKKFLVEKYEGDVEEEQRIQGQDENLTRQEMIDVLENEGAIVMLSPEQEKKLTEGKEKKESVVSENKTDIGNERYEDVETQDENTYNGTEGDDQQEEEDEQKGEDDEPEEMAV